MTYFFYRTTCLVNGKYYYGVHSERRVSDGYIGCGVCSHGSAIALKKRNIRAPFIDAVIKYGYENFNREVLITFKSREDAFAYERDFVNQSVVNDPMCYNVRTGGNGGVVKSACKNVQIINCISGDVVSFESQAECASFLGLKNISGKKLFLGGKYMLAGHNRPVSIKRCSGESFSFHDIRQAALFLGVKSNSVYRLMNGTRKSHNGWFLSDFDFSSPSYKHAKKTRKTLGLKLNKY